MAATFPQRIVCLTEETTETLYLLGAGDRVVGVSGYTARPPEARQKPKVSAFINARFDKIEALRPDLILAFSDLQAPIVAELIKRGHTVVAFNQRSVAEILQMIRMLGGLVGLAADANALADAFREGAAQMLPVVLVVALAKALVLLLGGTDPGKASVLNTLLYELAHLLEGLPASVAAWLMLMLQSAINFLVPSGSGQAALTMPILAPLGELLGVSRQVTVLAFQLGDGLTNLIVPTSAVLMGVLGAARIDWLSWARYILHWMLWLVLLSTLLVVGAVWAGYA